MFSFFTPRVSLLLLFATLFAHYSCQSDVTLEDTSEDDFSYWTPLSGIYQDEDSVVLASHRLSATHIGLATAKGIQFFNTQTNTIDRVAEIHTGMARPQYAMMNQTFTVYVENQSGVLYGNHESDYLPKSFKSGSFFPYLRTVLAGDRLYYQHDMVRTGDSTATWVIRYLDEESIRHTSPAEKEIQIPISSFIPAQGVINSLWTFEGYVYASWANNFYRIHPDGSYTRLGVNGKDFFPVNMFQIGSTLFALSNDSRLYPKPLLFSNDQGDTWEPYPDNSHFRSYDYLKQGRFMQLDGQQYVLGGFGLLSRITYLHNTLEVKPIEFSKLLLNNIESLYDVDGRYVYATTSNGLWRINKEVFDSH